MVGHQDQPAQNENVDPIPLSSRRGLLHPAFAWSGFTSAFASIVIGSRLQSDLGTPDALFAVVLGNWLLFIYSAAIGYAAGRWGLNSQLTLEAVFGKSGAVLPGILLASLVAGWFAFHVVLTTSVLAEVLYVPGASWMWICLVGVLFAAPVVLGFSHGFNLTALAFPAMTLFAGLVFFREIVPAWSTLLDGPLTGQLSFGTGVCIAFGTFVVSGTMTGDIVRFCRTGNEAIQATAIGFLVSNLPFLVVGVLIGAAHVKAADLFMSGHPISYLLLLLVLIAHWTTCDACLSNASVTLKSVFPNLPWAVTCCSAGIFGISIALSDAVGDVFKWVLFLVAVVPAIGGIVLADYYVLRANRGFSLARSTPVNLAAILALGIAISASLLSSFLYPAVPAPFIGTPLAAILYLIFASAAPVALGATLGAEALGAEAID
jgi:cytosine permease